MVMLVSVVLGAVMMAEVGLILGSWARDINTMFAAAICLALLPAVVAMGRRLEGRVSRHASRTTRKGWSQWPE